MKNIIIFAAGGGNDVFSAIGYAKCIYGNINNINIGIVSVLGFTPIHLTNDYIPNIINKESPLITSSNISRYLVCKPPKKIYCTENLIPQAIEKVMPKINVKYVCMSPKYSAIEQANNLVQLFEKWNMTNDNTKIDVVDFGGDILTNGNQSSIISPELDAFTLAVVNKLQCYYGFKASLMVCFPGVDGELNKNYLATYCNTKKISQIEIVNSEWLKTLTEINDIVSNMRAGNTIPNMIKILSSEKNIQLNKKWSVGSIQSIMKKNVDIDWELQTFIHVFNIHEIVNNNPFVEIFNRLNYDLLDVINHILKIYDRQSDIDENTIKSSDFHLQYLRKDQNDNWSNRELIDNSQNVMLVNIFPHIDDNEINKLKCEICTLHTYDTLYK